MYGNSNYGKNDPDDGYYGQLSWAYTTTGNIDVRLFYTNVLNDDGTVGDGYSTFSPDSWSTCRWDPSDETIPTSYRFSDVVTDYEGNYNSQICYTTEALMYAQSAYLVSIVC